VFFENLGVSGIDRDYRCLGSVSEMVVGSEKDRMKSSRFDIYFSSWPVEVR
jgi:hypothetical protein